jgi:Ca2+-binding RTX toxin-like protein
MANIIGTTKNEIIKNLNGNDLLKITVVATSEKNEFTTIALADAQMVMVLDDAATALADAQMVLDDAMANLDAEQANLDTAQANLDAAQTVLDDAMAADSNDSVALDDAITALEDATMEFDDAQIAVSDAQVAADNAQAAVDDAQNAFDYAQVADEASVDVTPPDAPVIYPVTGDNEITQEEMQAGVVVTGAAEAGAMVSLVAGDVVSGVEVDSDGNWMYGLSSEEYVNAVDGLLLIQATATDTSGNVSEPTISEVILENNSPPTGNVKISGKPTDGQTLTASNSLSDADGLGTISYQWLKNDSPIKSAIKATYTLTKSDVGSFISVKASYTDGLGILESVTGKTTTSIAAKPAPAKTQHPHTGTVSTTGTAQQGEILSVNTSLLKDADGFGAGFNYQWLKNGILIKGATNSTYTLTATDVGKTVNVQVSYTDGLGKVESESSTDKTLVKKITPTYSLSVDKASVNEDDVTTATFTLKTTNVAADTQVPFKFSGTISGADVLGDELPPTNFVVDKNGMATLSVSFNADYLTENVEKLTVTLVNDSSKSATVSVKDTSIASTSTSTSPTSPTTTSTGTVKVDGITLTSRSNSPDLLIGKDKNDSLTGKAGADTLRGNAGNDYLDGGLGDDSIEGGNGNDTLLGNDGNDKLIAGSGDDKLDGGAGNDTLEGGDGNDVLDGGKKGVDNMTGGNGNDSYFVDNVKDVVIETNTNVKEGGKDTVTSTSSYYELGQNVENLVLNDADGKGNSGKGNKSDNVITGSIGDNKLEGMEGNDSLIGGEGVDTLDGGLGMDTLAGGNANDSYIMNNLQDIIVEEKNGGEQDKIAATVDFNLSQSPNVEFLELSGKAKVGTGNELDNLLQEKVGGKIDNTFEGNEGKDTIYGEGGNDILEGGDGDDSLDGGDGIDTAIFTGEYSDYLIIRNPDVEGVPQLVVEYRGADETIKDGSDILTSIEILDFSSGELHNTVDIVQDRNLGVTEETSSSEMLILTGVVVE